MNYELTDTSTGEPIAEIRTPEAWVTEEGDAVVWGTHDPVLAEQLYTAHLAAVGVGLADRLLEEMAITQDQWANDATRFWGSPELLELDSWDNAPRPERTPVDGWAPYLLVIR